MKSTLALRCIGAVLGCLAIAAGAFWLGRQHPAAPATETAPAMPASSTPGPQDGGGDRSISFRPFAKGASDVFAEMARMREHMNAMRSQAFGNAHASAARFGSGMRPITLEDKGQRYEASLAAEGLENGTVEVSVDSGMLIIQGKAQAPVVRAGNGARSGSSSFHYRLSLPADAAPGSLQTECHDNRIIITLLKRTP